MIQRLCCREPGLVRSGRLMSAKRFAVSLVVYNLLVTACAADMPAPASPVIAPALPSIDPERTEIIFVQEGTASWYGKDFHGNRTSTGEVYNMHEKTCAHRTLPLNTVVRVTNLQTGSSTLARINDRGPFIKNRILDMSYATAKELGMVVAGTGRVRLEALGMPDGEQGLDNTMLSAALCYGNFTVQVGAFKDKANAQRLADKLKLDYESTRILPLDTDRGRFYRVRIGRYNSLEEAEKVCQALGSDGLTEAFALAE